MPRLSSKKHFYSGRFYFLLALLAVAVVGLIGRMLYLDVFNRSFLLQQSNARIVRVVDIPAYRGMIKDRFGDPLAISTPVDSVWVNPELFAATQAQLAALSQQLNMSLEVIKKRVTPSPGREFIYLKRKLPPAVAEAIKQLNIPGVFFQREYQRFYPEGAVTAHVIGFTNIDEKGQEGLELAFDEWLRGVPGQKRVIKDRLGHIIANVGVLREPEQGRDLVLSLDHRIQYLAYRELQQAIEKNAAASGSIVVLDAKTGEILAMVNYPDFNPNDRSTGRDGRYRNRAVTDLFEPGSTFKAFSVASGLVSGKYKPTTMINTNPGVMQVVGGTIKEVKNHNYGNISLTEVLQHSSNVGVAKIVLSLPADNFWKLLRAVGFGERTASGFPGEAAGGWMNYQTLPQMVLATMAFGYGISVTPLQLTQAYGVLAAGGVKRPTTFVKVDQPPAGEQVLNPQFARQMLTMLETVLQQGGTGQLAQVPGYRVAGKTGTAYIAAPHGGYYKDRYVSSFVGIAPVTDPRLVVAVIIQEPHGKDHYGGLVAAPAFSQVMAGALRMMNVAPDSVQVKN